MTHDKKGETSLLLRSAFFSAAPQPTERLEESKENFDSRSVTDLANTEVMRF